jgi:hypothetical protein
VTFSVSQLDDPGFRHANDLNHLAPGGLAAFQGGSRFGKAEPCSQEFDQCGIRLAFDRRGGQTNFQRITM